MKTPKIPYEIISMLTKAKQEYTINNGEEPDAIIMSDKTRKVYGLENVNEICGLKISIRNTATYPWAWMVNSIKINPPTINVKLT